MSDLLNNLSREVKSRPGEAQAILADLHQLEDRMSEADFAAHMDEMTARVKAKNNVADRQCGDCTACCTTMGVAELGKANYQPCPHNCGRCAIYPSRPRTCRSFSCAWLLGMIAGDERRRPDRLGLIFTAETVAGKYVLLAREIWAGAGHESNNVYLLQKMSQQQPVVLVDRADRCEVFSPDRALREEISRWLAQAKAGAAGAAVPSGESSGGRSSVGLAAGKAP